MRGTIVCALGSTDRRWVPSRLFPLRVVAGTAGGGVRRQPARRDRSPCARPDTPVCPCPPGREADAGRPVVRPSPAPVACGRGVTRLRSMRPGVLGPPLGRVRCGPPSLREVAWGAMPCLSGGGSPQAEGTRHGRGHGHAVRHVPLAQGQRGMPALARGRSPAVAAGRRGHPKRRRPWAAPAWGGGLPCGGCRVGAGAVSNAPAQGCTRDGRRRGCAQWACRRGRGSGATGRAGGGAWPGRRRTWSRGHVQAGLGGASSPNNALEPTPTAFARPSLRLLARLTAGVRLLIPVIRCHSTG